MEITLKNVGYRYKNKKILDHINLKIEDNHITGITGEYKSMADAKADARESDVILLAFNSKGSQTCFKPEPKCDKIVIDFDKKELTIGDRDVTIDKLIYEKDSIYDLDITMLTHWLELLEELRKVADSVEVLGTPPITGKDITNEMSDL